MNFEVNPDKIIEWIGQGILIEGQFIADTNVHNDDMCGYDIGEYRMTYTYVAEDADATEITVTYGMNILYYAEGHVEIQDLGCWYETDVSEMDLTELFGRPFDAREELKALVGV